MVELIGGISKCNSPADSTALTVAALATLKSTQEKRRFLLDLTSKVEEQKKLLEKKEVAKLTARTLVSAIYAISAASKALIPAAKAAATSAKTSSPPSVSQTTTSTTKSPTNASQPKIVGAITQSSSETKVVVSSSLDSTLSTVSLRDKTSEMTLTNKAPADFPMEELNSGQDVDMRIGAQPPVSTNKPSGSIISGSEKTVIAPNFYVENPALTKQEAPSEEASQPVNPAEMPEALKSLFSIIPGANYSHMSNIKDSSEKDSADTSKMEGYTSSSSTPREELEDEEGSQTGKKNTFNVSLLDFDYGDSDSDGEDSGKSHSKEKSGKHPPRDLSDQKQNTEQEASAKPKGNLTHFWALFLLCFEFLKCRFL